MVERKLWWSTWPGALGLAVLSAVFVWPAALSSLVVLLVPDHDNSGLDFEVTSQLPGYARWLAIAGLIACVILPLLTARWAKKTWLGYLLLGLGLSALLGIIGLFQQGIF